MKEKSLTPILIKKAANLLARETPEFQQVIDQFGYPPLWEREPGFSTLVHIILEQQVSLASAKAAFDKLRQSAKNLTPKKFLAYSDEELKSFGFSRQKIKYCRHLSEMILEKKLEVENLHLLNDEKVSESLQIVKGIGRWSADVYLLMVLLRFDIWPKGDIALATSYKELFGLHQSPTQDKLEIIAEKWRPYRSVAARILWKYYLGKRGK